MSELADVYNVCMIFVHSRTCQISDKNLPTHPDRTSYEVNLQTLDFIMKVSLHYVNVYGVPHIAGRILGRLVRLGYVEKLRSAVHVRLLSTFCRVRGSKACRMASTITAS